MPYNEHGPKLGAHKSGAHKSGAPKAKSYKADGTPKKRWTPDERNERGHGPRSRGGQRDRDDRPATGGREDRPSSRTNDRGPEAYSGDGRSYGEDRRKAAAQRKGGNDRPTGGNRYGNDRPTGDRGSSYVKPASRNDRDERPRYDRDERPRYDRDDRARDDRGGERHEGASSYGRSRAPYGSRPTYGGASRGKGGFGQGAYQDRPKKKSSAWGRDVDPMRDDRRPDDRRPDDRRSDGRTRSDERRFDDRPRRDFDRPDRNDRHDRRDDREDGPVDTMEWQEADALEVDTSTVTGANGFAKLGVPAELVAVLSQKGISDPFPIQRASIPDALAGHDVLGRGRTGSGKTLGFTLPLLARIKDTVVADGHARKPQAIILEPTRELAMQVADVLSPLSRALGLRSLLVAGGMSYDPQRRALSRGVDVIVATPGRLIDLIEQGAADLSDIRVTVLDEADEMADMGFLPEVTRIMDETPAEGQRLLFSATLDKGVDGLVRRYMHSPKVHEVDSTHATFTTMEHLLVLVKPEHKAPITAEIANREGRTIIFARTQKGVDRIAGELRDAGVMAGGLHGGLTQGARARVMAAFKNGTVPVLVATDVAARGIHVDDVGLVLQVDPPADSRDYTHRAGRTARAGSEGIVVSLILPHQRKASLRLAYQAGVQDKAQEARPDEEWLYRATGARRPSAEPIEESAYEALIAPKQQPRRQGARRFGGNKSYGHGGRRRHA